MASYTEATQRALSLLRSPDHFQWTVVPLLAFVIYIYFVEVERKNWNVLLAGLAFYGLEWFLEIANALVLHFTRYSAVWTAPGGTAYLITVGLNIEISFMFAVAGIAYAKALPKDRSLRILGIPNRWFFVVVNSLFCVLVEVILNFWGALVWSYSWWNWPNVWLIVLVGYMPYMIFSFWVHDTPSMRAKVTAVTAVWAVDAACLVVFLGVLKWI